MKENRHAKVCDDLSQVESFLRANGLHALASSVSAAGLNLYAYGAGMGHGQKPSTAAGDISRELK